MKRPPPRPALIPVKDALLMMPLSKAETVAVQGESRAYRITREIFLVLGASLFVALCAKVTWYLPFTPVPLSLQNFGVLLVGLLRGSRRRAAGVCGKFSGPVWSYRRISGRISSCRVRCGMAARTHPGKLRTLCTCL